MLRIGEALKKFEKMVYALGGPADFVQNPMGYMPRASIVRPVFASREGYVCEMQTRDIGLLLIELKGGRTDPSQTVDHATGFTDFVQIGDRVDEKTPLCYVHAQTETDFENVAAKLQSLIKIGDKPKQSPVILEEIR